MAHRRLCQVSHSTCSQVFLFLAPPETSWKAARFFRACSRSNKKNQELKMLFFWRSVKLLFGESVALDCCAGVQSKTNNDLVDGSQHLLDQGSPTRATAWVLSHVKGHFATLS